MVLARIQRNPVKTNRGDVLRTHALLAALLLFLVPSAASAQAQYALSLDPVAYDNSMRDVVRGEGRITATLNGSTLALRGNFFGLSSPATKAQLGVGLDFAVPATEFFATLAVSNGTMGTVTGTVNLTPAQVAALNRNSLFLRLDSVRGTEGSLWGWFERVPAGRGR
jgi:hypothetical protein